MRCPGCNAELPGAAAPDEPRVVAAPECWALFNEAIGREFSSPAYWPAHHDTVGGYYMQHTGNLSKARIGRGLIILGLAIERDWEPAQIIPVARRIAHAQAYTVDEPPQSWPDVTIVRVHEATSPQEHIAAARAMAKAAWEIWSPQHGVVRRWMDELHGRV